MSRGQKALWISLALVVSTLAVYAPVRHYDFVDFDDPLYVRENPHLTGGLTAGNVSWAMTAGYATNWHPLTWMSHMLDVQFFGLNAGPQHLTNLAFHVVNTLLLFWLLHRMTGAIWKSGFVAALFALHPLHVESVAWISERKDVLSTFFWLLTMWAYTAYARKPSWQTYSATLVLFALGLMAKPMLVTLPFVLLLVDVWPLDRLRPSGNLEWKRLILEKVPFVALAAASTIITFLAQLHGGAVVELGRIPLGVRMSNALVSYAAYIVKMIWPSGLTIFYPYPPEIPLWQPIAGTLVLIAGTAAAFRLARRYPFVPVGWLWYVVTLLPVIGIVQVGRQALADRYTYVPFIGLFIIIAWGVPALLERWPLRRVALPAVAGAIVVACAITARAQVGHWENSSTLWQHALDVTANNDRAENGIGVLLENQGRMAEAEPHFAKAIRIDPTFAAAHHNLGATLASQGRIDDAIVQFREAIRFGPEFAVAHYDLGVALAMQGHLDEAMEQYRAAIAIQPDLPEAHGNLGGVLASKGLLDEGMAEYREALRLKPSLAEVHGNLARALAAKGRLPEALEEYSESLRLKPQQADVLYNRGFAYATMGKVDLAIADFTESVSVKPDFDAAHMALGMALGASGRMDEAKRELARVRQSDRR